MEEYKKEIKKSLKKNGKENQQNTIKENAWKAVLENTTVNKYPKKDLKNMISSIKTQYKNMASYYNLDFADFLKQYMNMDEETFNLFVEYHLATCERQELVGAGAHTVDILEKRL